MGEAHLTRRWAASAADQGGCRRVWGRCPEGPAGFRRRAVLAAGVDLFHLGGFAGGQRRQQAGRPVRQHGLARTYRADHEEMMTAGQSYLKRPFGGLLAPHF
ncbi:MAG TPA: hypothetical protein VGX68_14295 [Thermoanaerobaculia bacterium]|nr:hypothetical protein [Thermoanaerobaculia bacterium]